MEKIIQKKSVFNIYLTTLIILLIVPFSIYSNRGSDNLDCLRDSQNSEELLSASEIEVEYVSISILPNYENILCLGKITNFEIDGNETLQISRAYSDQLFTLGLDLVLILFFLSPFFSNYLKTYYVGFQIFQFIYFFLYIYFILDKFGYYAYNVQKYDAGYIVLLIFLLNLKFNKNDVIGLLSQFIFFALFGTKYFGLIAVILILSNKDLLKNKFMNFKIFIYLPIIKFILFYISSIFEKLNILWLSLMENPHSGYTRYFDLQWNLVSLVCEKNPNFSAKTNFAGERFCPSELYSPIYQYLSFKFNIYFAYLFLMGVLMTVLGLIYLTLLKNNESENYFLVMLFLSPALSYQIYQGNLDFLSFVVISGLMIYKIPYFLKMCSILFVALLELHPMPFLLGVASFNIFKKDYKKLFTNVLLIVLAITIIWTDNSELSVKNWNSAIGFSYIYHPEMSFGLSTDHIFFLGQKIQPLLLYPSVILIYLISIFAFRSKMFINKLPNKFISEEDFLGYTAWYGLIIFYENFSYRLAVFTIIFYFLFLEKNKLIQGLLVFAVFLTPTSLIEFDIIRVPLLAISKLSLYVLTFFIFHKAFQILFINSREYNMKENFK